MGDAADYLFEMELLHTIEREEEMRFWRSQGYWTTRDNRRIKIIDIEDSHLLNIDKMLRRNKCISKWPEITREIKRRGIRA